MQSKTPRLIERGAQELTADSTEVVLEVIIPDECHFQEANYRLLSHHLFSKHGDLNSLLLIKLINLHDKRLVTEIN